MSHYPTIGWYGKLPSAGDFLQRRFPDVIRNSWENWFQVGLHNWQKATERQEVSRPFGEAPVWNFVVPPMLGSQVVQMGCLLPGRDSVGRQYPLCAQQFFSPRNWSGEQLAGAGGWYQRLGSTLLNAVRSGFSAEQLDSALLALPALDDISAEPTSDILQVIGDRPSECTLSWKQAAASFTPQHYTSFWWTNQTDGYPLYTHVHSGNLTGQLFSMLFDPAGGAEPGRNGLYPPMFN